MQSLNHDNWRIIGPIVFTNISFQPECICSRGSLFSEKSQNNFNSVKDLFEIAEKKKILENLYFFQSLHHNNWSIIGPEMANNISMQPEYVTLSFSSRKKYQNFLNSVLFEITWRSKAQN